MPKKSAAKTDRPKATQKKAHHDMKQSEKLVGSIDQGTSSSRFIVFSADTGMVVAMHQMEISREHPKSGWVQQSATDIYNSTLGCMNEVAKQLTAKQISLDSIVCIGMTNQRETTIAWDKKTGEPLCPAIVWSDVRTASIVRRLVKKVSGHDKNAFQHKTGLPLHSYFSASKIIWMLENEPDVAKAYKDGRLKVGTVDSWLIYKLTGGHTGGVHVTDVTNACRTLLLNLESRKWDPELCEFFDIDSKILPTVISSGEVYGKVEDKSCLLKGRPLGGILGDQQAALVGQTWECGTDTSSTTSGPRPHSKVTFGTGAFLLWNIGTEPVFSNHGILTTIAFQMGASEAVHYALEGSVAYSGATMDWLKNKLNLFDDHKEEEILAQKALLQAHGVIKVKSSPVRLKTLDACYVVPAFSGLFCPHWREDARGAIIGFDEACDRGQFILAGLRASAYQTQDVLQAACKASSGSNSAGKRRPPRVISVDGGLSKSNTLMQSLADLTGATIQRPNRSDVMTALGAAVAALLAVSEDPENLLKIRQHAPSDVSKHSFSPLVDESTRKLWMAGWQSAVSRSLGWQPAGDTDKHGKEQSAKGPCILK